MIKVVGQLKRAWPKIFRVSSFFVLVLVILTLGGCHGRGKKSAGQPGNNQFVKLKLWTIFDSKRSLERFTDSFNERQETALEVEKVEPGDFERNFLELQAAGNPPDLILLPTELVYRHRAKLEAFPESLVTGEGFRKAFIDLAADELLIDGKIFGLPLSYDTLVLYANRELTQAAKLRFERSLVEGGERDTNFIINPKTWSELTEASRIITQRRGDRIEISGLAFGRADNILSAPDIVSLLMLQYGAEMVSADKKTATFDQFIEGTIPPLFPGSQALDFYTSFADRRSENYSWNGGMGNVIEAFVQNRVGYFIGYTFLESQIMTKNPSFDFQILSLPKLAADKPRVDFGRGLALVVPSRSANKELALRVALKVSQNDISSYQASTGRPLALRGAMSDRITGKPNEFQGLTAKSWFRGLEPVKVNQRLAEMINKTADNRQNLIANIREAARAVSDLLRLETEAQSDD